MKIVFFTLFPNLILPYFEDSILKKAKNKYFEIEVVNFRDFANNNHKKVDTEIVGGGAGMIIDNIALRNALIEYKQIYKNAKTIFLTPVGKKYNQKDAIRFSNEKVLFLVCGRYEGFDERLIEDFADEVISIGDFILTGGELGALVIADSVLRNIKGVLGNEESLKDESFNYNLLEAPQFSKVGEVPIILKSGNHKVIKKWKEEASILKTKFHRPDLIN
ncbi:tRNA (guanosine(37)-N1)-methyltransferase TrmD [Caminibacter mediatlanticus TB-2]|uniref:tRNA (guanine-N(1)-)-methyltransferase n=1 Tax=Caminibacter mediatlanticus TB-2 TaxID=391592 RepID=A0AAI9AHY0_9BACT|nr:tRNA (guanosine(37)-N1)-methyltransferase TrmD [Caminibacter mediatlanticus]EDM24536.1 tRNA (guanine-N(1)-)-methyltransferase [Caminibacter mediatlanticus TB-2]QCT95181.1 tRNA (guanosine(37)-N1)-methyltransferase TrmD [Caminibacter mediatlanticus TB-2]